MVPDTFGNPMRKLLGRLPPAARATLASIAGSWTSRVVAGVVAVAVVALGFAQGSIYIVLQVPAILGGASVAFLQAEFALLNFAGFLVLSALALGVQVARRDPPTDRPETGPDVAAIVPVYRDADTVHRSVKSLLSAAYDDLHVYVVCEPDDDASIARARELEGHHDSVTALVNERPGSKAGAVNYAADVTDTEYLAVFDADELVHPEFVPAAVAELREADVVQGRTIPEPDGFVETAAYYESVILGELTDRLVSVVTGFRLAASHAIVMRRSAFEDVDGYDPEMLTEDYDFAFRCYDAGLDVREQFANPSRVEAAHSLRDWWGQRKRWMTGYAQVLHRRLGGVEASIRSVLALGICAGSVVGNLLLLSMVAKAAVLLAVGAVTYLAVPVATLAALGIVARYYDTRAGNLDGFDLGWTLVPLVLPLYSLVGIVATVEYVTTWDGEWYSVDKTGSAG